LRNSIAEWMWRAAVVCALVWIGWELHRFHGDMMQPIDDTPTVTADADEIQNGLEDVRDDLAGLNDKVDAILIALARTR
jgi:hypothetical protein